MNLHEYQTKQLFKKYGLPIPIGYVCSTSLEIEKAIFKIGPGPWILKCQIHAGGRGKAGGVIITDSHSEVKEFIKKWLGKRIITTQTDNIGKSVNHILVETPIDIITELYLSIIIDRNDYCMLFLASSAGGMDIEKIAKEKPQQIYQIKIDPLTGAQPYQGRMLAFKLGLKNKQVEQFTRIFLEIAQIFIKYDLDLLEINPLVINRSGDLCCLDGKISVDNNAVFRQQQLQSIYDFAQENPQELQAKKWGLNYVALHGNIGCIVNGAGLAMATMDMIHKYGGFPANFLDIGGDTTEQRVIEAFKIILSELSLKVIFVNIFGGIVRCDLIAEGIINAIKKIKVQVPIVVRLQGNNALLGAKKIIDSGLNIIAITNLIDAIKYIVRLAKEK